MSKCEVDWKRARSRVCEAEVEAEKLILDIGS